MSPKLKILIVDDHAIVRDGLSAILKFQKDMTVVGEAEDGPSAVRKARELEPDVVILDLMMPGMDGTEATPEILKAHPGAKILLLTSYGTSTELGLSTAGVKFHLLTIFRKLNVSNRAEAVGLALRKHLFRD